MQVTRKTNIQLGIKGIAWVEWQNDSIPLIEAKEKLTQLGHNITAQGSKYFYSITTTDRNGVETTAVKPAWGENNEKAEEYLKEAYPGCVINECVGMDLENKCFRTELKDEPQDVWTCDYCPVFSRKKEIVETHETVCPKRKTNEN